MTGPDVASRCRALQKMMMAISKKTELQQLAEVGRKKLATIKQRYNLSETELAFLIRLNEKYHRNHCETINEMLNT